MPDPAVPPEAYEAAELARKRHVFATTTTCRCGFQPLVSADWDAHLVRVGVDAAAPFLVAAGRRQAAEAIRSATGREEQPLIRLRNGNMVRTFEVPEWAARIAEGNTDA